MDCKSYIPSFTTRETSFRFQKVPDADLSSAYKILHDSVDWQLRKGIKQWTVPFSLSRYESHQKLGENFYLTCNQSVVGVVILHLFADSHWTQHLGSEPVMWLSKMAVAPAHIGKGYGHVLLEKALEYLSKNGCRVVYIECVWGNGFLADFYKSHGFALIVRKEIE